MTVGDAAAVREARRIEIELEWHQSADARGVNTATSQIAIALEATEAERDAARAALGCAEYALMTGAEETVREALDLARAVLAGSDAPPAAVPAERET